VDRYPSIPILNILGVNAGYLRREDVSWRSKFD